MQRKRHINFKLHSIPILLNMKKSTSRSISNNNANDCCYDEKNNVKSNVLYSIPCVKSCAYSFCRTKANTLTAFLLVSCSILLNVIFGNDSCSATTTASLSLSNPNMTSAAITPGSTATVSTNVTVSVDNADSYSLSLKVDSTTLKNGNTTINPGNVTNDNTWGYKWDGASSYTAPNTTGTNLTVPTLTNNSVSFTKNLTFGAKFATNAEAGHYRGSGTLSLAVEPKAITGAEWTLPDGTKIASGIEYMQDINAARGGFCKSNSSIPTPASKATSVAMITLKDRRNDKSYIIGKLQDGNCWMLNNLNITDITISSADSDFTSGAITIPKSSISGFTTLNAADGYAYKTYYHPDTDTNYYNWYTATAGAGTSSVTSGSVSTSICPKNWKLPTGGNSSEYKNLGDLATSSALLNAPYNFAYIGRIINGNFSKSSDYGLERGFWWTSTAYSAEIAYGAVAAQDIMSSLIPGTYNYDSNRQYGFAVRCMARYTSEAQSSSPK